MSRRSFAAIVTTGAIVLCLVFAKMAQDQRSAAGTPVMLSGQIDDAGELHDVHAVVNGRSLDCAPLKDTIQCGDTADSN